MIRLDVPWQQAMPREAFVDGTIFDDLRSAADRAHALGMHVWFRLLQPALPHWVDDEGGLSDRRTAATHWPRWVELAADELGDHADGWVPFEAPNAMANRLEPEDPRRHGELVQHLFVAWRDAWRILRGPRPVISSIDTAVNGPTTWLTAFRDGVMRVPGRLERRLDDLAGSFDVVGIATRSDFTQLLERAAVFCPDRPLALTYRPIGNTDTERARHVESMWRTVQQIVGDLPLTSVIAATFVDADGTPGMVTTDRELNDTGEAFTRRSVG